MACKTFNVPFSALNYTAKHKMVRLCVCVCFCVPAYMQNQVNVRLCLLK